MKRKLFLLFIALHFCVVIYNNMIIEEQAIKRFFYNDRTSSYLQGLLCKSKNIFDFFTLYSKYTGAETGFGFYAPNVSNDVVLLLTHINTTGQVMSIEAPRFHSQEAILRYASAMGLFIDKIDNSNPEYNDYMNSILKSIALWNFRRNDNDLKTIMADLMIYDLPSPDLIQEKKIPLYLKLGHYEYSLK